MKKIKRAPKQNMVHVTDIELEDQMAPPTENTTLRKGFLQTTGAVNGIADSTLLGTIFFLNTMMPLFEYLKPILFPFAILFSGIKTTLSWINVALQKAKNAESIVDAVVNTLTFLGITAAVSVGLAIATPFVPIIFTAILGANVVYETGKAIFHVAKAINANNAEERKSHAITAGKLFLGAAIGLGFTVGVGGLLVGGIKAFIWVGVGAAAVGVGVGVVNAAVGIYSIVKNWNKNKKLRQAQAAISQTKNSDSDSDEDYDYGNKRGFTPSIVYQRDAMQNTMTAQSRSAPSDLKSHTSKRTVPFGEKSEEKLESYDLNVTDNVIKPYQIGIVSKNSSALYGNMARKVQMQKLELAMAQTETPSRLRSAPAA